MTTSLIACSYCKHCELKDGKLVCKAFPDGIPEEYFNIDTRKLKECANGIKYEEDF